MPLGCNCFLLLSYCRTCVWGAPKRIVRYWWFLRGDGGWDKEAKYHRSLRGKHRSHTNESRKSFSPTPKCSLHRSILIDQNLEQIAEHHQQKERNVTQLPCQWVICFLLLFRGLLVAGLLGSGIPGKLSLQLSISVKRASDFQLWTLPWVSSSLCCWVFVAPWATVYLFPPHILIIWAGGCDTYESSLRVRIKTTDEFACFSFETFPFSLCFCFHQLAPLAP